MFIVTYSYAIPRDKENRYLDIQRRVRSVYLRLGCVAYEVFKSDDRAWLEITRFRDKNHHENVKKSADADPDIELLWKELCTIVQPEEIVTSNYEKML